MWSTKLGNNEPQDKRPGHAEEPPLVVAPETKSGSSGIFKVLFQFLFVSVIWTINVAENIKHARKGGEEPRRIAISHFPDSLPVLDACKYWRQVGFWWETGILFLKSEPKTLRGRRIFKKREVKKSDGNASQVREFFGYDMGWRGVSSACWYQWWCIFFDSKLFLCLSIKIQKRWCWPPQLK